MNEKKAYLIRPTFFNRSKLLIIGPDYISLGKDEDNHILKFSKEEIESYRYQSAKVRIYVYLYYYYKIDIRSLSGKVIRIRMLSFAGIGRKKMLNNYSFILNALFDNFFKPIIINYLQFLSNGIDFEISGLIFTQSGLLFSKKQDIIPWADIATKDYYFSYTIYSKKDNYNYKSFNYWDDWNTAIIYSLTRTIIKERQLS